MDVEIVDEDSLSIVRPQGRIDSTTSPQFEEVLSGVLDRGVGIVLIDMSGVSYVSSAGLQVLLTAAKRMRRESGWMRIFGLRDLVREVFQISGFVAILDIRASETDARQDLRESQEPC